MTIQNQTQLRNPERTPQGKQRAIPEKQIQNKNINISIKDNKTKQNLDPFNLISKENERYANQKKNELNIIAGLNQDIKETEAYRNNSDNFRGLSSKDKREEKLNYLKETRRDFIDLQGERQRQKLNLSNHERRLKLMNANSILLTSQNRFKKLQDTVKNNLSLADKTIGQMEKRINPQKSTSSLREKRRGLISRTKRLRNVIIDRNFKTQISKLKDYKVKMNTIETPKLKNEILPQINEFKKKIGDYGKSIQNYYSNLDTQISNRVFFKELNSANQIKRRENFINNVNAFEKKYPNEKLNVDWNNLKIKSIDSSLLKKTINIQNYSSSLRNMRNAPSALNLQNKEILNPSVTQQIIKPKIIYPKLNKDIVPISMSGNFIKTQQNNFRIKQYTNQSSNKNNLDYKLKEALIKDKINKINKINLDNTIKSNPFSVNPKTLKLKNLPVLSNRLNISQYNLPKQSILQKIKTIPSKLLSDIKDFSKSYQTQKYAEGALGVGNVSSYGYINQKGNQINKKVESLGVSVGDVAEMNRLKKGLDTSYKNYKELTNAQIPKFESKYGSDKSKYSGNQIKKYNSLVTEQNKLTIKIKQQQEFYKRRLNETSKTVDIFGYKKQFPVTEVETPFGVITASTKTLAEGTGKLISHLGKKGGYLSIPKHNETSLVENQGTTINNPITGKRENKKVVIPRLNIGTKSQLKKIGTTGLMTGLYLTPYVGGTLVASSIGTQMNQVNYNPIKFVEKHPIETTLIGGALVGFGGLKVSRELRKPIIKETKNGLTVTSKYNKLLGKETKVNYLKINEPVQNLKAKETLGLDIYRNKKNIVIYPKQKVEQVGYSGVRRQVIEYKKGRFFGLIKPKENKVYEGIPKDIIGRKKALKLLKDIKNKNEILRYTAPTIKESKIEGLINVNKKTSGLFKQTIEQPSRVIDESFGIKTRASNKPDLFFTSVERRTINKEGKSYSLGLETTLHTKLKNPLNIDINLKGSLTKSKVISEGEIDMNNFQNRLHVIKKENFKKVRSLSFGKDLLNKNKKFIDYGDTLLVRKNLKGVNVNTNEINIPSNNNNVNEFFKTKTIQKTEELKTAIKPISISKEIGTTKTIKPSLTTAKTSTINLMTGKSIYAGSGLSTMTESVSKPTAITPVRMDNLIVPPLSQNRNMNQRVGLTQKTELSSSIKPVFDLGFTQTKQEMTPAFSLKSRQVLEPMQMTQLKTIPKTELSLSSKQMFKQKMVEKQVTAQSSLSKQKSIQELYSGLAHHPKERVKEKERIIKRNITKKKRTPYKNFLEKATGRYEVYKKVKGKEVKIGTTFGIIKATGKLKKGLKKDLSASGFIINEKTGKKVRVGSIMNILGSEFRKSKYKKGVIVQKLNERLSSGTERRNIQKERTFFKRRNGKFKIF